MFQIKSSPQTVYRALTEQEGLRGWWTILTTAKAEVGFVNSFDFSEKYRNRMRITELQANRRVAWECLQGGPEWIGTTFVFDIDPGESGCTVRFEHGNWKNNGDFFANCNYHWGFYMRSLKSLCESGTGTPFIG